MLERVLKSARKKKLSVTAEYFVYSNVELKEFCLKYITEEQFLHNDGWELDHIIPVALFDTSNEFFGYTS